MNKLQKNNTTKTKIHKNDRVEIIAGKDKGKKGTVLRVFHSTGSVIVEGRNLFKKAQKKRKQNERGGIREIERPLHISNVMLLAKNGKKVRVQIVIRDKKKIRVAHKTHEEV